MLQETAGSTTAPAPSTAPVADRAKDPMPLNGIDHIELYVGNAAQAAYYYVHAFGFHEVAYAGLETGVRDRASHVLRQGRIRLVLTGALSDTRPPMSWNERRALSRSNATICWSISSIWTR